MSESASILVVDPDAPSRNALCEALRGLGYRPLPAVDPEAGGHACREGRVDLVLLARVPGPGGVAAVVRQCRGGLQGGAEAGGEGMVEGVATPLLVVGEAGDREALATALREGAGDFLMQPLDPHLLRLRIESLLAGKRMREHELAYRRELEAEVAEKGRQLAELNRKLLLLDQAKSDFLRLIAHEMRTPLNGLLGSIGLLFGRDGAGRDVSSPEAILKTSAERLLNLVEDATLLSRLQVAEMEPSQAGRANLSLVLDMALHRLGRCPRLPAGIPLPPVPHCEAPVAADEGLLMRAFQCLLQTAVLLSREGFQLELECTTGEERVEVVIATQGPLLAEEVVAHFFDLLPGHQVQVAGGNLGLIPALARRIVTLFDGELLLGSLPPDRIELRVRLPRYQQELTLGTTGIFFTTSSGGLGVAGMA
jgi:two-component system, sensor histidine kinase and response regulator